MHITQDERQIMTHIERVSLQPVHFRSKTNLKILASLEEKGLITFDPFEPMAALTEIGKEIIHGMNSEGYP